MYFLFTKNIVTIISSMSHIQVYSDIAYANTNMFTSSRDEKWQILSSFSTLTIIYMVRITRVRIFITRKSSLWNGLGINITQILNLKEDLNLCSFFFHISCVPRTACLTYWSSQIICFFFPLVLVLFSFLFCSFNSSYSVLYILLLLDLNLNFFPLCNLIIQSI